MLNAYERYIKLYFETVRARFKQLYLGKCLDLENMFIVGRDSVVGIATRYGLDGPGIEIRWGHDFRTHPVRPDRPWGTGSFPGVKRLGSGVDPPISI